MEANKQKKILSIVATVVGIAVGVLVFCFFSGVFDSASEPKIKVLEEPKMTSEHGYLGYYSRTVPLSATSSTKCGGEIDIFIGSFLPPYRVLSAT